MHAIETVCSLCVTQALACSVHGNMSVNQWPVALHVVQVDSVAQIGKLNCRAWNESSCGERWCYCCYFCMRCQSFCRVSFLSEARLLLFAFLRALLALVCRWMLLCFRCVSFRKPVSSVFLNGLCTRTHPVSVTIFVNDLKNGTNTLCLFLTQCYFVIFSLTSGFPLQCSQTNMTGKIQSLRLTPQFK